MVAAESVSEPGKSRTRNNYPLVDIKRPELSNSKLINYILAGPVWRKRINALHPRCISCYDLASLYVAWVSTIGVKEKPLLVYDSHEFELERSSARKRGALLKSAVRFAERFLMGRCAFSIMVNDSIADEVQRIHGLSDRPVVVRNTPPFWELDEARTAKVRERYLEGLGAPEDAFIVMYHGNLQTGRGLEVLIRLLDRLADVRAVVLGDGEAAYVDGLRALARSQGVDSRLLFLPAVPYDELRHWVSAADIGMVICENVCKSYYYMLPNKFFENVQSETPIIASDFPETGRLVREYGIGLACDPSDLEGIAQCVERLRDDKALYARCKDNLRAAKKELCWEKEGKTLEAAYAKALGVGLCDL